MGPGTSPKSNLHRAFTSQATQDTCAPRTINVVAAASTRPDAQVTKLDEELEPELYRVGDAFNKHWGYISRAGHDDKSHMARQIEKYADIYCAKVTNLYRYTPYHFFRAAPVDLAHDLSHE